MAVGNPTASPIGDSQAAGERWQRRVGRGLPILAVIVVMAIVSAIAAHVYDSNRQGALSLSSDLLDAIDQRITTEAESYLRPAQQFLEGARTLSGARGVFEGGVATEAFAVQTLRGLEQVAGYSYGDPQGNFMYVTRNALGGLDTKLIDRRDGKRVTWTRRDAQGRVTGTSEDPSDEFDPRVRPWYRGVAETNKPFWTEAYLFFTAKKPGITYSLPHLGDDARIAAVSGVDIELAAMSGFLAKLKVGTRGRAIVVDQEGRVIAFPSDDWLGKSKAQDKLPMLDELGDPTLVRVQNRLRIEGYGRKVLEVGDQRIIVTSGPLKAVTGRDWTVLIVVPEADFVGFVASSSWVAVALSIVVFTIMAGLAALMVWRSLRAERRDRGSRIRQAALELRAQTFAELASSPGLLDRSAAEGVREATARAAETCRAQRASVWYLAADGRTLVCEDSFDRSGRAHTSGAELHRDELPALFKALGTGRGIDALDGRGDPRTREFAAVYLDPLGTRDVHIAPIRSGERLLGMLMVENPNRGNRGIGLAEFCSALSSLLALRYLPGSGQMVAPAAVTHDPQVAAQRKIDEAMLNRQVALQRSLLQYSATMAELATGRVEQAAIAVVRFPDWLAMAQRSDGGQSARMEALIDEVRRAVARSGVAYASLLDDQVVLAAFSGDKESIAVDARVVALAALDVRDRLIDATSDWGDGSEFRIALDIGPAMISTFGEGGERTLWGGAIGVAKLLASSGSRRAITVSEAAYLALSGDFLFRQRGTYFLPETGTMRTFVLVGEL